MTEAFPPLYNFDGINFNSDYFAIPNTASGGGGISIAYANSHYLASYAGAVATSFASSTSFSNKIINTNTLYALPSTGTNGGNGDRLVIYQGSTGVYPYSIGVNNSSLWFGTPASANFKYYINGVDTATLSSTGLVFSSATSSTIDMSAAVFSAISFNNSAAIGMASAANNFFNGVAVGDFCVRGGSGKKLFLGCTPNIGAAMVIDSANVINLYGGTSINANMVFASSVTIDMTAGGNSGIIFPNSGAIAVAATNGSYSTSASAGDMVIRSESGKNLILQAGNGSTALTITGATNNVCIGGTAAAYPLVVGNARAASYTVGAPYGILAPNVVNVNQTPAVAQSCTMFVNGNTVSSGNYFTFSDRRIKKDIKPFENALEIIDKLNISTFKYIDYAKNFTDKKQYGLIAQEVADVIPDIVNKHIEFIPNVFKNANGYDNETKSIIIDGSFDISIGDTIQIFDSKNKEHIKKIVDIQENVYTIDESIEDYEDESLIFIYGKEVNDLHTINYEHLFNINLKATSELYAIVKAQQEQINKLLSLIK